MSAALRMSVWRPLQAAWCISALWRSASGPRAAEDDVTGTARSRGVPTEAAKADAVTPAPGWIKAYCAKAAHKIERRPVLCPARTPNGIQPTENLALLPP